MIKTVAQSKYNRTTFSMKYKNYEKCKHLNNGINKPAVEQMRYRKDTKRSTAVLSTSS